jgi:hypothetical protein
MSDEELVCKWCRWPIRAGHEKVFGELIAPWIHKVGMYSCPVHPETMAEPADTRWEKVFASVSSPEYDIDDPAPDEYYRDFLEFRIEVIHGPLYHYVIERVHKNYIELTIPGTYGFILDKMVAQMDERLKEVENAGTVETG